MTNSERLRAAVRANDLGAVAAILDGEPALVSAREDAHTRTRPTDEPHMTLLHVAVAEGHAEIVDLLISRGVDMNARNGGGRTPLHDCFELGHDTIARRLIAAGATIDVCAAAAFGEHARLAQILAADPAQANDLSTHLSPLGWSAYAGDVEAARILIAHGAIVDEAPYDQHAWGPVCHVANVDVARMLLAHGADPNCQATGGDTPLHQVLASRLVRDPTDFIRALLEAGADPDLKNQAGRTPLDDAQARQGEEAETYFPRRGLGAKDLTAVIELLRAARAAPR